MSDHQITTLEPLYTERGKRQATCVCGWQSEALPTPGQATIAALGHINSSPPEIISELPEASSDPVPIPAVRSNADATAARAVHAEAAAEAR
jgi:hypothetical protein